MHIHELGNNNTKQLLLFILIVISLYYFSHYLKIRLYPEFIVEHSLKLPRLPKTLCRLSDGSTFMGDRLNKLYITKVENKSAYANETDALKVPHISQNFSTLNEFIQNLRTAFMSRLLIPGSQSITTIFRTPPYKDMVKPSCDGLWMEFGVYRGDSITRIAKWKSQFCGNASQPVYGFDTFTGLPTNWRSGFNRGTFRVDNATKISVPSNVILVKGLFIDTLPNQLRLIDDNHECKVPASFIHVDCDIYDGARDILFLLGSRFVPGTILVFDELFNYPSYEKHEVKALFEFLSGSDLRLTPLGASGNIQLETTKDLQPQSFAFVIDS